MVILCSRTKDTYEGRGANEPLQSRDIEDIINVFDGRLELNRKIKQVNESIQNYISYELTQLFKHNDFEYAVQSSAQG